MELSVWRSIFGTPAPMVRVTLTGTVTANCSADPNRALSPDRTTQNAGLDR